MSFQAIFSAPKADPARESLMARVREGTEAERREALNALLTRAREGMDPDDISACGLALHMVRRNVEARGIFTDLLARHPGRDDFRLNLASVHSQLEEFALCQYHFSYLAEHAGSEEMRQTARDQLEGYRRFLGIDEVNTHLRDLQLAAIRARAVRSAASAADYQAAARKHMRAHSVNGDVRSLHAAERAISDGLTAFPDAPELLEFRVVVSLKLGDDAAANDAALRLEKVAPDSPVVAEMRQLSRLDDETGRWSDDMNARAQQLMMEIQNGDTARVDAALAELAKIAAGAPANKKYRLNYAFGLLIAGRSDNALAEAVMLAEQEIQEHSFHFNLGQIFWGCGAVEQGRHHLGLALEYATNNEERQDVFDRLAELDR